MRSLAAGPLWGENPACSFQDIAALTLARDLRDLRPAQRSGAHKRKIRENLATRLDFGRSWEGAKVCTWVVAVMGAHDRDKDVDNLVKGILDAIQGKVYSNDASIQHLNATKIRHASSDGYYLVSVRPVRGYLDDVIDPNSIVIWPGIPKIEI
jgi:Holliday junction resolvase RusA-like endonuclease